MARALNLAEVDSSYFIDNPASGRVLEKLGFATTGLTAPRFSCARGGEAPARHMWLPLSAAEPMTALAA